MANDYKVSLSLEAEDNASKSIQGLTENIDKMKDGVEKAEKSTKSGFGGIGTKAIAMGNLVATAVTKVVDKIGEYVSESIKLAEANETISNSYNYLSEQAGINADKMLAELKRVSQGTATETSLMEASNKAMALGVAGSVEQMSQLMQIAMVKGQEFGETTEQAFNDMITGLGRNSAMILDNLGIVIDSEEAYKDYADSIGKSVDALTEQEQKQALVNAVIKNSSKDLEQYNNISVSGSARLKTSLEELQTTLGKALLPVWNSVCNVLATFTNGVNNLVKSGLTGLTKGYNNVKDKLIEFKQNHLALFNLFKSLGDYLKKNFIDTLNAVGKSFSRLGTQINNITSGAIQRAINKFNELMDCFDSLASKAGFAVGKSFETINSKVKAHSVHIGIATEMNKKMNEVMHQSGLIANETAEAIGGSGGSGGSGKSLAEATEEVSEEVKATQDAIEQLNKELENERELARENAKALYEEYSKALDDTANKIEKLSNEIIDLQEKMDSINSGATEDLATNYRKARDEISKLTEEYGTLIDTVYRLNGDAELNGIKTADLEKYTSAMKELEAYKNLPAELMSSIETAVQEQDRFNNLSKVEQIIEQRDAKLKEIQVEIDEKKKLIEEELQAYIKYYQDRDDLDKQYTNLLHQTFEQRKKDQEAEIARRQRIIALMQEAGAGGGGSHRAGGGPVASGNSYIVGEHGPELFIPNQNGKIIPNNQITNNNGIEINISGVNVRSNSDIDLITDEIVRKIKLEKQFGIA